MPNYEQRLMRQGAVWSVPPRPPAYREAHQALRVAEEAMVAASAELQHATVTTKRGAEGRAQLQLLLGRYKRAKGCWLAAKDALERLA